MTSRLTNYGIRIIGFSFATGMLVTFLAIAGDQIMKITKRKKITRIIETISEWTHPNVSIVMPERVEEVVCRLIKGGPAKLLVISDFDQTLLKTYCKDRVCNSNHRLLLNRNHALTSPVEEESFSAKEPDDKVCIIEWYLGQQSLGPRGQDKLGELVSKELFYQGASQLLESLASLEVPLYLGAKSPAEEILRSTHLFGSHVNLFSPHNLPPSLPPRPNVLILASSSKFLVNAIAALPPSATILSIGFLTDQHISSHHGFDVVVSGEDHSLAMVNSLMQKVAP